MRICIIGLLLAGLLLLTSSASAQECEKAQAVTAPCKGVLLPQRAAEEGLDCLAVSRPLAEADAKKYEALNATCEKTKETEGTIHAMHMDELNQKLLQCVSNSCNERWYRSPYLWGSVGFVGGTGITVLIVYLVKGL